ncbi:phosphoglycolate phosphatase [soil metagenome]
MSARIELKGVRAVIIDLDGTMLDTAPDFQIAVNRMREEFNLAPIDLDSVKRFVGKGSENLVRCVLGIDYIAEQVDRHFDLALASYQRHYLAINGDRTSIYPGVRAGLDAMQAKGLRLACVTNKPVALAIPLLEKMGLRQYFELVFGGDSLPHKKPHPQPFLKVCEEFALLPQQVVAIGDSSNDAQAARAAGCRVLTVPYGYNHGEPVHGVDSDGIVASLLDAANLISS